MSEYVLSFVPGMLLHPSGDLSHTSILYCYVILLHSNILIEDTADNKN